VESALARFACRPIAGADVQVLYRCRREGVAARQARPPPGNGPECERGTAGCRPDLRVGGRGTTVRGRDAREAQPRSRPEPPVMRPRLWGLYALAPCCRHLRSQARREAPPEPAHAAAGPATQARSPNGDGQRKARQHGRPAWIGRLAPRVATGGGAGEFAAAYRSAGPANRARRMGSNPPHLWPGYGRQPRMRVPKIGGMHRTAHTTCDLTRVIPAGPLPAVNEPARERARAELSALAMEFPRRARIGVPPVPRVYPPPA